MKKKRLQVGILITVVGALWGYILITVVGVYTNTDPVLVTGLGEVTRPTDTVASTDTIKLQIDYPDPFLKRSIPTGSRRTRTTAQKPRSTQATRRRAAPAPVVRKPMQAALMVQWPDVVYFGAMVNRDREQRKGMITVDGQEKLAVPGLEIAPQFQILHLNSDSLVVVHLPSAAQRGYAVQQ